MKKEHMNLMMMKRRKKMDKMGEVPMLIERRKKYKIQSQTTAKMT
jgi:hypothetical protein